MGRWATYKKRGGGIRPVTVGPPPPPTIEKDLSELFSIAAGGPDVGGWLKLWRSPIELGEYLPINLQPWQPTLIWGDIGEFEGFWYKAQEIGNGTDYQGPSELSGPLYVEET